MRGSKGRGWLQVVESNQIAKHRNLWVVQDHGSVTLKGCFGLDNLRPRFDSYELVLDLYFTETSSFTLYFNLYKYKTKTKVKEHQ